MYSFGPGLGQDQYHTVIFISVIHLLGATIHNSIHNLIQTMKLSTQLKMNRDTVKYQTPNKFKSLTVY